MKVLLKGMYSKAVYLATVVDLTEAGVWIQYPRNPDQVYFYSNEEFHARKSTRRRARLA